MILNRLIPLVFLFALVSFPSGAQVEGEEPGATSQDSEALLPAEPDTDVPEPSGDIDEMVVLASGRDDFLKNMSVSVTSFSAAEIKSLRIQNIADLADFTPNLEINTRSAASNPTLFIRGIGLKDYNANAAAAVAVYNDGVNINAPAIQLGQLFDIEQIIVLRGPQGSVNGRNATAGAIMINSVLPNGEVDASIDLTYGNYNYLNVEGAVAFPIIEDLLSSRIAFTASFRDGYVKNHCANWDPIASTTNKALLSEQSIRDTWDFNGRPDHPADADTDSFRDHIKGGGDADPGGNVHRNRARGGDPHYHLRPGTDEFPRYPVSGTTFQPGQLTEDGRELNPDNICIFSAPGFLLFDNEGNEPTWTSLDSFATLTPDDFQGVKRKFNNVKNWAGRMLFRLQPDVGDGMDWILNLHGGQNLADAAKLQSISSEFHFNNGDPFLAESQNGTPEVISVRNSGFEGRRVIKGILTNNGGTTPYQPGGEAGADIDAGFYDSNGLERLDAWGSSLRGDWDTGSFKIYSITGYEQYKRLIYDEGDASAGRIASAVYNDKAYQFSEELRITGEAGEIFSWAVGGFALFERLRAGNLFPGLNNRRIEQDFTQDLLSLAGYLSGRYWLLDEVYLDAGGRYNRERKTFSLVSAVTVENNSKVLRPLDTVSETWTGFTGDVTLGWEPQGDWMYDARLDHLNMYLKFGRGMKGGHFNAGLTIQENSKFTPTVSVVEPEFIDAVEVGFKSRWLQDRLSLKFAAFRYWYTDYQVFEYSNERGELPIQKLLNSDAAVLGAEIEIQVRPVPGLKLQISGGWLDSEFLNFVVSKATQNPRGQGDLQDFDYSGNPTISSPDWSVSALAEQTIELFGWGSLVPQYTVNWRSKVFLDPQALDPISQDAYWQHNARLAYRTPDGRFEVAAWVENFLEKRYKIDHFDISIAEFRMLEVWNEPRMFGVTVSAYF
jgi:outer membrane receptor protein involved in Fe transport